ncbi:MAG: hypothetical protein ACM3S5_19695 [Rhodospirillales bacterium]
MPKIAALLILSCSLSVAADDVWSQIDTAIERLFQLKAKPTGARYASALAALVCRLDRERARAIFIRAMEHLKAADGSGAGDGLPARAYLIRACRSCDPALAAQLAFTPGASIFDTFRDHLRRARLDVSTDPEAAAASILRAAPALPFVPDEQRTEFARLLLELRGESAEVADGAFMEILEILLDEPAEAVPSLFALGNYVLTPIPESRYQIMPEGVEGGGTAYVFRAERPGVSDELVVAYLESAVMALAVAPPPWMAETDDELRREMLGHIRPFVATWAAHMRTSFDAAARRLSADALEPVDEPPAALPSKFTFAAFYREWTRGRGEAMRGLLSGLRYGADHRPYEVLASFSEAVHAIGAAKPELAASIASRMPEGIHKTLVHGGLPGRDYAFLFYREASQAGAALRPGLLLVTAQLLVPHAPDSAMAALLEAVQALNEFDRARRPLRDVRWTGSGFIQRFGSMNFRLTVPTMPKPDFRAAVAALTLKDPTGVLSVISNVQNERRRASALVAWAEAVIQGKGE